MNTCSVPANDNDIEGIREYLIWSMQIEGMSSNAMHYVDVLVNRINKLRKNQTKGSMLAGYALSCRKSNTKEWMDGMVRCINEYAKAVDDTDRFEFNGHGFIKQEKK